MLPSAGTIFFCPFTDSGLYAETEAKVGGHWVAMSLHRAETLTERQAQFFNSQLFGTDFSGLYQAARDEVFGKISVVVPW